MTAHPISPRILRRATVLGLLVAVLLPALFATAQAKAPDGSLGEVILEPTLTGDPTHAIQRGWWGHGDGKKPTTTGTTFPSLDLADGTGTVTASSTADLGKLFGDKTLENLRVAFVPYSADGSNERPKLTKGENAGEAFAWFTDFAFGSGFNGAESENDSVITVSTLAEWTAWWKIGRPLEGYLKDLSVVTIDTGGQTAPATAPEGKSILNRWPAGTKISMVFYKSDGYDEKYPLIPRVAVGKDGRAISAWLTFRTVAHPTDPARTSAGFEVLTYSPPSAYPGGDTSRTGSGSGEGDRAPNDAGAAAGSGRGGSSADDGGSGQSKVADVVPGGMPVLVVLLALLAAAGVAAGARLLRPSPPARDPESSIPDESALPGVPRG